MNMNNKTWLGLGLAAAVVLGGIGIISANYVESSNTVQFDRAEVMTESEFNSREGNSSEREFRRDTDTDTSATEKGNGEMSGEFGGKKGQRRNMEDLTDEERAAMEEKMAGEGFRGRGPKNFDDLSDEEKAAMEERFGNGEMPGGFPENGMNGGFGSKGSANGSKGSKSDAAQSKGQPDLPDAFDSSSEV